MKKNLLVLLCMLLIATCALASCNNKSCDHTFSDEWYGDETNHWHPATCEHGEVKDSLAAHADADQDGICDVCAREVGHKHTYEANWTYDEFNHWKNATCLHTAEKGEYSLHVDEDNNNICDACSSHVHKLNGAGYCQISDCGKKVKEVDENNIDELILAVYDQNHLVNGSDIDYLFEGFSNTSIEYTASKHDIVKTIYGKNNYTYSYTETSSVNGTATGSGTLETWHQLKGKDDTFGVVSEDGGPLALDISNVDRLQGYYIALSTLAGGYGAAETLYSLYEAAIGGATSDDENLVSSKPIGELEIEISKDENKVTFKYNYQTVFLNPSNIVIGDLAGQTVYNVNYFEVEVSFCYSDEYALTELVIKCDSYTNDPGTSQTDGFLYDDVDIEYDPDTDTFRFVEYDHENGVYIDSDRRTPDVYTITVTQTVGERTEENPNPQSKFIPKSFDLYQNWDFETGAYDKKVSSTINSSVKNFVHLYVANCKPEGTSLHMIHELVTFELYRNGELVADPENYENEDVIAFFTFSGEQRMFTVYPKVDGAYQLKIFVDGKLSKEVNIIAGTVAEEDLVLKSNEFAVQVTEAYEWTNEVTFTAKTTGKYIFNLPLGVGFVNADEFDAASITPETDDGPKPYYDYQSNDNRNPDGSYRAGSFSLELEAGQSIRFYVNASKVATYVITFIEP